MALLKSFQDKARLARQLSFSEWLILVKAWRRLLYFHMALKWVSYERFKISVGNKLGEMVDPAEAIPLAQHHQRLVHWASRLHFLPMTCLVKSLTLNQMLTRRGIPSQVRIGMKKSLDEIQAHAWVEVMGEIIGEAEDIPDRFTVLESPAG